MPASYSNSASGSGSLSPSFATQTYSVGNRKILINKRGHQAADDHDGKGTLRIRADAMRERRRQQSQRGHQHGHHDGAKPQDGAFHRGIVNRMAADAELVDVFDHDDPDLHGDAEQGQESDAG